jgi:dCTP deaminase
MIITGSAIARLVATGDVAITPFEVARLNPNSYNYRLGPELIQIERDGRRNSFSLNEEGVMLDPSCLYLGSTFESIGSERLTTLLIGRSSVGRLGLFVQIDADLGQRGAIHKWTLELRCTRPLRIYPYMTIGQVSFWETKGDGPYPEQQYARFNTPTPSLLEYQ